MQLLFDVTSILFLSICSTAPAPVSSQVLANPGQQVRRSMFPQTSVCPVLSTPLQFSVPHLSQRRATGYIVYIAIFYLHYISPVFACIISSHTICWQPPSYQTQTWYFSKVFSRETNWIMSYQWGETPPHMTVKCFGCTAIHNKVLYKCLIHSFISVCVLCVKDPD